MAGSRMTFVAEFVDRLTGPSTKAKKAVEDLGKATADAAKKSEQANRRAEGADQKRASSSRRAAEDVRRSEGRKATAAAGAATAAERASRTVEGSERRRQRASRDTATVVGRAAGQQRRASQTTAQAIQNHGRRVNGSLTSNSTAANRTASAIQQMAGRSTRSLSGMQTAMDRVNPSRMASRYNSALSRMLSRTQETAGKIQGHLDKINDSGVARGAQLGATAVGGMALAGGAKRIADVQQADVVMETMGIDKAGRDQLAGQYKGLAQNTPYSTGSVSMLGSSLLASGMSQDDLQGALQGAIDTGALFNMSLEDIGMPLKQIQAKGKAQGDDIMQLTDRGIPIYEWLAEQKGVDQSEVADLVSKGQVSSDDVFQALSANSKGGADKASKTLAGSWNTFKSSVSQGGQAFLEPLVGPLTELLQSAKVNLIALQPHLKTLGEFTAVIVKGITPALPVLIPLVATVTAGIVALAIAAKAALVVKSLATGMGLLARGAQAMIAFLGGRGRGRGATGAVGLFTEFLGGMRDGAREAYGQRGLGGLNAGLDTATKKMGKAQGAAKGLKGALSNMGGIAATAGGLLGGMAIGATSSINADLNPEGAANSIATGGDVNAEFKNKEWANKNGSILGGTMSGVNGIGDVVNKKQNQGWGDKVAGFFGDGKFFGYKDGWQKGFDSLAEQDSALAGLVGTPEAGTRWNSILADVQRAGSSPQDALASFPEYKAAVTSKLTEKGIKADDNTLLQYMGNTAGYRRGGFTGMGSASGVAGVVHGREYVMPESVTSRPGMLPALRQIHRTGELPRTYHGDTTSVQVSVNAAGATVESAQAVGQSVEEAVARVLARRERRAANRHGTRELRGAN